MSNLIHKFLLENYSSKFYLIQKSTKDHFYRKQKNN